MPKKKKSKKDTDVKPEQTEAKIPAAVLAAGEQANKLQEDIIEGADANADGTADDQSSKSDSTDASEEGSATADQGDGTTQSTDLQDAGQTTGGGDDWEEKYKILQGKYNSEMEPKDEHIKTLTETVQRLTSMLEAKPADTQQATDTSQADNGQAAAPADLKLLDVAKLEAYGEEFKELAEFVNELAKAIKSGVTSNIDGKIEQRLQSVERTTFMTAEQKFFEDLHKEIPKEIYQQINQDPNFPIWLSQADPISRYVRKDMLDFAFQNLVADQAVAILKQYSAQANIQIPDVSSAANQPANTGTEDTTQHGNLTDKTVDNPLAAQAMPGSTVGSGGEEDQSQGPKVDAQTYNKAVNDYTAGRINRDAFLKIESAFQAGIGSK